MRIKSFLVVLSILLVSCASYRYAQFKEQMDSSVGQLTIEEAIAKWGPPAYERKSERGTTIIWLRSRYVTGAVPAGYMTLAVTRERRESIGILFDDSGVMRAWNYIEE